MDLQLHKEGYRRDPSKNIIEIEESNFYSHQEESINLEITFRTAPSLPDPKIIIYFLLAV
jgi:hypothetical protein